MGGSYVGKIVYLDNAATSFPKPEEVYSYMDYFYRQYGVNVGRGQHTLSSKASNLVNETRQLILELFSCFNKKVIFTPSATESMNVVLRGLNWDNSINVYTTPFEHNAVLRVLHYLKNNHNLNIEELFVDKESMDYDIEKIKYQFQDKPPNVVIMSHASNVSGLIAPIKDICDLSKKYNSTNIIDMAQTAGLINTNLNDVKADYVIFAGHKTLYGPFGIAGIILDANSNLSPLMYGGTGIESANPGLPKSIPERFEVGSLNIHAIAGLNAALKWIAHIGIEQICNKEIEHADKLIKVIREFDNIKTIGFKSLRNHIGIVSCVFDGYSSDSIGKILNECHIAVRTGLHCAPSAHRFLETFPAGTVRFSVSYFNDDSDFEKLHGALQYIEDNT